MPLLESKRYFWLTGHTIPYRQEIRDMGGVWDPSENAYRLPWAVHIPVAVQVASRWKGCELRCLVPALPLPRPDSAFMRLRLVSVPLVWNGGQSLAVVGDFYAVEVAEALLLCHPLLSNGKRSPHFFVCLDNALDKHFESQV